jgi:Leucine-rich repeat (LRR) protein
MPLERLVISNNDISSLEPLRKAPLQHLSVAGTRVADFSPVLGKRLIFFSATDNVRISSIEFLRGMPLDIVSVGGCKSLTDISTLAECPTLKRATFPRGARGIELLRKLPKIEAIGYGSGAEKPAAQFWAEFDAANATPPK